ncbi:hypothetical protein KR222_009669, partial [Zaprionus bogoriensis]
IITITTMSTSSEQKVIGDGNEEAESSLQQLKAKKNKSNLFLIKSYSFIERNNNTNSASNNNNNNNNNDAKMSRASAPLAELLLSPDMEAFPDIASLVLAQATADSQANKQNKPKTQAKQPKVKAKAKQTKRNKAQQQQGAETDAGPELDEQEAQLLRRNPPHEYEELLQHLPGSTHGSLPRPHSLPAKVHLEAVGGARLNIEPISLDRTMPTPAKRRGANIKRESFLRQSLQSIRRSFGSNKHAGKLSIVSSAAASPLPSPSPVSSNASTTSSTSSSASSCSSGAAITMLTRAQANNHILDEFLPTPVVLLLKDDPNYADFQLQLTK